MKILLKLITLLLLLTSQQSFAKLNVFYCEPEWAALAKELGGDHLHIVSATTAQQDPHHIQARPSLIAKIRRADLIVCTGAELEIGWLPLLLRKSANGKIQVGESGYFMATQQVSLLGKPTLVDRSMGDIHMAGNPHIQFDPYRMAKVAKALTQRLMKIDPAHDKDYQQKGNRFLAHWQKSIQQWEKIAQPLNGKAIVIYHQSWVYLSQWLGLKQLATLEPKAGVPPTSRHLSKILGKVKDNPPDLIIYAGYQSHRAARWLAKKTGKKAIAIPFSVSEDETLTQWYNRFIQLLLEASQ